MAALWVHHGDSMHESRVKRLYYKLSEPRAETIFSFFIYMTMAIAGITAFLSLPSALIHLVGQPIVTVFGLIGFTGSALSMLSIVPAVHWLERTGILLLITALSMYGVMMLYLDGIPISLWLAIASTITLAQRLFQIRH